MVQAGGIAQATITVSEPTERSAVNVFWRISDSASVLSADLARRYCRLPIGIRFEVIAAFNTGGSRPEVVCYVSARIALIPQQPIIKKEPKPRKLRPRYPSKIPPRASGFVG